MPRGRSSSEYRIGVAGTRSDFIEPGSARCPVHRMNGETPARCQLFEQMEQKGRPSTGASGFAVSGNTVRRRVAESASKNNPVITSSPRSVRNSAYAKPATPYVRARNSSPLRPPAPSPSDIVLLMGFTVKQQVPSAARAHQLASHGSGFTCNFVEFVREVQHRINDRPHFNAIGFITRSPNVDRRARPASDRLA